MRLRVNTFGGFGAGRVPAPGRALGPDRGLRLCLCLSLGLSLGMCLGLGAAACTPEPPKVFALSAHELAVDCAPAQVSVDLSANVPWNIMGIPSWLSVSPASGEGNATLHLAARPHVGAEARGVTLTFVSSADPHLKESLSLSQGPLQLEVDGLEEGPWGKAVWVSAQGQGDFVLRSNAEWTLGASFPGVQFSPDHGSGDAAVHLEMAPNTVRLAQQGNLYVFCYGAKTAVDFVQEPGPNNPPQEALVFTPRYEAQGVSTYPYFSWSCTDPDQDPLQYTLYLSADLAQWEAFGPYDTTATYLPQELAPDAWYYFKVRAEDGQGGVSETPVNRFLTSRDKAYQDGEARVYMASTKSRPSYLVFTGDGYTVRDFGTGGKFDQEVAEAVEAIFATEPYKSFREYFTVLKVAAYSEEEGLSHKDRQISKNTAFSTTFEGGGTGMTCLYDKVFTYARKAPGITEQVLSKWAHVVVLGNDNRYAGTCYMISNGKTLSMCPVCRQNRNGAEEADCFHHVLMHEGGGHGYGHLADEYVSEEGALPDKERNTILGWQGYGFFHNLALSGQADQAFWAPLVGRKGYERVGMYEGAHYYPKGIWRAEQYNCMIDNRLYYSAWSRYLIMKRIVETAGEPFDLDFFLAHDKDKDSPLGLGTKAPTAPWAPVPPMAPLAPPVLIVE